jgi:hypothetical protein
LQAHISAQLLAKLQQSNEDPIWDDHPHLLLWLLFIGGAFAPPGIVRSNYSVLLASKNNTTLGSLCGSWPEVLGVLDQFIWSERAFKSPVNMFWEENFM